MITKDQVIGAAKQTFDPEIPIDIWELGLIYDIEVGEDQESVKVRMTLTTQACPSAQQIPQMLKDKVLQLGAKDVDVQIVFDPPWTQRESAKRARKN